MQEKDEEQKVKIFAIGFMSFPPVSDEKQLRVDGYLDTDMSIFTKGTLKRLCNGIAKARIDMRGLVMIMDFEDGQKLYLDNKGVVKIGRKEHYIEPSLYVYVWSLATIYGSRSRGIRDVFIKIA